MCTENEYKIGDPAKLYFIVKHNGIEITVCVDGVIERIYGDKCDVREYKRAFLKGVPLSKISACAVL